MSVTYLRLLLVVALDPGVVPLGPDAAVAPGGRRKRRGRKSASRHDDVEAHPYEPGPDTNPDSPGLERFYSKEVFVCDYDGRPRYCSACRTWKPDRVHHSSEINRCVRKMDHFCPWVGGIVSETCTFSCKARRLESAVVANADTCLAFKFFVQFTFYTTLYCAVCMVAAILCLTDQLLESRLDGTVIAIIAMGAFFGLFTFGMTATSLRYIFKNLTTVDILRQKSAVYQLAVRVPQDTLPSPDYGTIVYPLPKPGDRGGAGRDGPSSSRDRLATRTFAIVRTDIGENPWDLGLPGNWVSVMGTNPLDWLLPVRPSPCVHDENDQSFYRMGPLCDTLRSRYRLPRLPQDGKGGVEMGQLPGRYSPGSGEGLDR